MPVASRKMVTFWHVAVGAVTSCTVTTDVQVLVLLCASVTVRVTVCAPASAQVYESVAGANVRVPPQLSVEPLLSWEPVTEPVPEAFRETVTC